MRRRRLPTDGTPPTGDEPFDDDLEEPVPESNADRIARLRTEIAEHGREWRTLVRGPGTSPPRAYTLQEMMSVKQRLIEELEPEVEVQVTAPLIGLARAYVVGERTFPPGRHRVKQSVAEVLAWLMDQDRIMEARRMKTLDEQRAADPLGLNGILDPSTQINRPLGIAQG